MMAATSRSHLGQFFNLTTFNTMALSRQRECFCGYRFKYQFVNGRIDRSSVCRLCGVDFKLAGNGSPKLFQLKMKQFKDQNLYQKVYKRWPNEELIKSEVFKSLQNHSCSIQAATCNKCTTKNRNNCCRLLLILQLAKHHLKFIDQQKQCNLLNNLTQEEVRDVIYSFHLYIYK